MTIELSADTVQQPQPQLHVNIFLYLNCILNHSNSSSMCEFLTLPYDFEAEVVVQSLQKGLIHAKFCINNIDSNLIIFVVQTCMSTVKSYIYKILCRSHIILFSNQPDCINACNSHKTSI